MDDGSVAKRLLAGGEASPCEASFGGGATTSALGLSSFVKLDVVDAIVEPVGNGPASSGPASSPRNDCLAAVCEDGTRKSRAAANIGDCAHVGIPAVIGDR